MKKGLINKVWTNYPKWVNWIITIFSTTIIGYFLIQYIRGVDYSIVKENLIYIIISITTLCIVGIIIAMYKIIEYQDANVKKNNSNIIMKDLKPLPANFELEIIQNSNFQWVFKVCRYFHPDSTPDKDRFIDAIEMSKSICVLCKSDIEKNVSFGFPNRKRGARCPNRECELYEKLISGYKFEDLEEQEKIKFISAVRKNFDKYWKIYCDEYNRITKGKNDEFVGPIKQMWQSL